MTITTVDQLERALRNRPPFLFQKASRTGASANEGTHHWISGGVPGAGGYPASIPEACSHLTPGAISFTQQQSPIKTYLAGMTVTMTLGNPSLTAEIRDRLVHTPSVVATTTTPQSVNCDLNSFLASENIDARKGPADFSQVIWSYESIGTHSNTVCDATVNVTYHDGSTGDLTPFSAQFLSTTRNIRLNALIPAADQAKNIRGINTITFSVALAGGSGAFSAARYVGSVTTEYAIQETPFKLWDAIGLSEIHNNSCLFIFSQFNGSDTGELYGTLQFVSG